MYITLLAICITIIVIHSCFYVFIFNFFNFSKSKKTEHINVPVSVIVCAKNEADNLEKLIPKLVVQNYDHFEIILINDRSSDRTLDVFEAYADKYSFIKIVNVTPSEHFHGNKKYALTLGIKAAKNDCLLFTDADCIPNSKEWIQLMVNQFSSKNSIVLGYGPYQTIRNSFLNKLIRFETLITALQYFSFAKIGTPYMGVGRNLMYSKALFIENKGFNEHINIMSGDDDLLINKIAHKKNTAICFDSDTFMVSEPKTTLKQLITQKRRHISTAKYYKKRHKTLLGLYALNRLLFWIVFPISFCFINHRSHLIMMISLVAFKFFSEYIVVGVAAKKLKEKGIVAIIPILDLFLLIFQLYLYVSNTISKPRQWS
ncbi:glycosyltransferase [Wenyingzhuangia sp. IMCC45533]